MPRVRNSIAPATTAKYRREILDANKKRQAAAQSVKDSEAILASRVRMAIEAGVSAATVAEWLDVSRTRVYQITGRMAPEKENGRPQAERPSPRKRPTRTP